MKSPDSEVAIEGEIAIWVLNSFHEKRLCFKCWLLLSSQDYFVSPIDLERRISHSSFFVPWFSFVNFTLGFHVRTFFNRANIEGALYPSPDESPYSCAYTFHFRMMLPSYIITGAF